MKDEQFDDLKQFIDSRISQSEARMEDKLDGLRQEMLDGFSGVGEAIEEIHGAIDQNNKKIGWRVTKLEKQAAR